jgi:outer membrane immunogenic protein
MKKLTVLLLTATALSLFSAEAMAADLMMPMKSAPMMAAAPASTGWDGLYLGASVGYSWGTADDSSTSSGSFDGLGSLSGGFIGGQVGYNFHLSDNVVLGIQGDINWNNESAATFTNTGSESARINWDGAIMGRLGYDAGQFLPYVEAGVAFANMTVTDSGTPLSATHTGYALGAGVQFMLSSQLSANVEYRYSNYGSATYESGEPQIGLTDNSVRLGLDFHLQ